MFDPLLLRPKLSIDLFGITSLVVDHKILLAALWMSHSATDLLCIPKQQG